MRRALAWIGTGLALFALACAATLAAFRLVADAREVQLPREAAPPAGRFVPASDVNIYVQEAGPPQGTPVLFVHGTGAWSETWRGTLSALAKAGFRAIAIDVPPFGFSERPSSGVYDAPTQGKRILGALDALTPSGRVVLVGHSFGGGPAMEAVLLDPGRFSALILVDVALGLDAPDAAPPAAIGAITAVPAVRDAIVATFLTNPRFTRRLLQGFIADPAVATDARVAIYQQPLSVSGSTHSVGQWLPALFASRTGMQSADAAAYSSLKLPALVIWGALDTVTPLAQGKHIAAVIPGARLAVMQSVGHIPQIEDPRQFDHLLLEFLRGLKLGGSA